MNKIYSYLFIAFLFTSANLYATTYYVSPSGNDGNAGTSPAAAWQTVLKIDSLDLQPGDSILFEGGQTFNGYIILDASDANDSSNVVTFSSYGSGKAIINSADQIGFYAYNTQGFTVSNLVFEGSGMHTNTTSGVYLYADLDGNERFSNVSFKYVEIRNYGDEGLVIGAWPVSDESNTGFKNVWIDSVHVHDVLANGIDIWGFWDTFHVGCSHENVHIMNTLVHDVPGYPSSSWKGSGIVIAEVDSGVIEHCVAHDNGTGNSACGGPVGIWAWDANNVTIQYCESYHNSSGTSGCDGGGFDFDGGQTNSVMQYNYSHDNAGYGFESGQFGWARPMYNNVIRYNISENDGQISGGGLSLFKGDPSDMKGAIFYNNTVYLSPASTNISKPYGFNIVLWDYGIDSVQVYNNIFLTRGSRDSIAIVEIPDGYSAFFAGNLFWSSGDTMSLIYQDIEYSDLESWRSATGNEMVNLNSTGGFADPLLTNAGNGGTMYPNAPDQLNAYKLSSNSPAVNSGLDLTMFGINTGGRDFFGNAVYGAPDMGAYESSFTTSLAVKAKKYKTLSSYPNPVTDKVYIALPSSDNNIYTVHIFDMNGREVLSPGASVLAKDNFLTIDVRPLASGIYTIQAISAQGINWAKMVKE